MEERKSDGRGLHRFSETLLLLPLREAAIRPVLPMWSANARVGPTPSLLRSPRCARHPNNSPRFYFSITFLIFSNAQSISSRVITSGGAIRIT